MVEFFCGFIILKYVTLFFFQANMLQKVILLFLLCVLPFQFYHSRYLLIDVYDKDNGPRNAGCGEYCSTSRDCTDSRCPLCDTRNNCTGIPTQIDRGTP